MMSEERMMKVMAYADGELDAVERHEVEGWLESDPDARRLANTLGLLGELVQEGHAGSATQAAIASFDVVDAVMESVSKGQVHALDRRRHARMGGAVVAALALAASVFLFTRHKDEVPLVAASAPRTIASVESSGTGVEVDPAETQGSSIQVFYLTDETSPTTSVVVWVDEHGAN